MARLPTVKLDPLHDAVSVAAERGDTAVPVPVPVLHQLLNEVETYRHWRAEIARNTAQKAEDRRVRNKLRAERLRKRGE